MSVAVILVVSCSNILPSLLGDMALEDHILIVVGVDGSWIALMHEGSSKREKMKI